MWQGKSLGMRLLLHWVLEKPEDNPKPHKLGLDAITIENSGTITGIEEPSLVLHSGDHHLDLAQNAMEIIGQEIAPTTNKYQETGQGNLGLTKSRIPTQAGL